MSTVKTGLGLLLLLLAAQAFAADNTVFGLPLGEPLSVPECARSSYGYVVITDKICFERLFEKEHARGSIVSETVSIRFPISELPSIVNGTSMLALVLNGRLEGIGFNTHGVSDQEIVLSALKKKYGEPKVFLPHTVQNLMGASFKVFTALWQLPNIVVTFQSTTGEIDAGLVNIDTKIGSQYRTERLKELTGGQRKL